MLLRLDAILNIQTSQRDASLALRAFCLQDQDHVWV